MLVTYDIDPGTTQCVEEVILDPHAAIIAGPKLRRMPRPLSRRLRIAIVHSEYSADSPSGENVVVAQQIDALQRAGHEVEPVLARTDDLKQSSTYALSSALRVASGRGRNPLGALRKIGPDVVHVHNLHPNWSRAWVQEWSGPLVASLHNYRPICPAGSLFRDGANCADCLDAGHAWPALRHACYRGSRAATLPLAVSTRFDRDPLLLRADVLTVLSDSMRDAYVRAGVPPDRLVRLDNFVNDPGQEPSTSRDDYYIYVGRVSPEKGVLQLIDEWPEGHRLLVVGGEATSFGERPGVEFLGRLTREEVRRLVGHARGLVFPSRWLEGLGLVCLEALSVGTPILAWHPAPAAQMVEELGIGIVGERDIVATLSRADRVFPDLYAHCRDVFLERFSEAAWLSRIENHYQAAVGSSSR